MQVAILIYHYCGASKVPGIYKPIRVLVAAYLFMTGYGHTMFYLKKSDFSILRLCQILIRLNLLTIVLAYTMNTNYLSYYFSPLVSMWFLMVYFTLSIGRSLNNKLPFLLGKIFLSASLVTWFMNQLWLLERLFHLLARVCKIQWDAREWAFRVNLDLWIVYVGMLSAIGVTKFREYRVVERPYWPLISKISLGASCISLIWFFIFELSRGSKFTYNAYHPFVSFVPILAFVALRNATSLLRSSYSSAFVFIGKCSLETFVIQYHLWLAGDTRGILVVIPGTRYRAVNFLVTTVMFVFVSDRTARATVGLTSWMCEEVKMPTLPTTTTTIAGPGADEIPLQSLDHDETGSSSKLPSPDAPVDYLTRVQRVRTWLESIGTDVGIETRLILGMCVLWILNVLWER